MTCMCINMRTCWYPLTPLVFKELNWGPRQPVESLHPWSNLSPVLHELQVSPEIFQGFTKSWKITSYAPTLMLRLCAHPAWGHEACLGGSHQGRLPQRGHRAVPWPTIPGDVILRSQTRRYLALTDTRPLPISSRMTSGCPQCLVSLKEVGPGSGYVCVEGRDWG